MRFSMSLFVIYFGTKRRYNDSQLAHHNIILSSRYKPLLDESVNRKVLADDFSLYLHMPTLTDPSLAPEGCEAFYVLSPVPHLGSGVDWNKMAKPYRDRIMQFLEDNYLPDLQANIIAEHTIDPLHFNSSFNSYLGAAFSVQPLLTRSAWFRPHNRSEDFRKFNPSRSGYSSWRGCSRRAFIVDYCRPDDSGATLKCRNLVTAQPVVKSARI